jgi:hypothetical protein
MQKRDVAYKAGEMFVTGIGFLAAKKVMSVTCGGKNCDVAPVMADRGRGA